MNTHHQGKGESTPNSSLKIVLLFDGSDVQVSYIQEGKHPLSSNISTIIIGFRRTILYSLRSLQEMRNIWFSREFFQHHYLSYIKFGYHQSNRSCHYLFYHQLKIFNNIAFMCFKVHLSMLSLSYSNYNSMFRLYK